MALRNKLTWYERAVQTQIIQLTKTHQLDFTERSSTDDFHFVEVIRLHLEVSNLPHHLLVCSKNYTIRFGRAFT